MCWSFEASVVAALVGFAAVSYLWYRGRTYDRALAVLFFVVVSMQAIEAVLWKNQECNRANDVTSKVAIAQNFALPYAMLLALFVFAPGRKNAFARVVGGGFFVAYTAALVWYVADNNVLGRDYCTLAECNRYCHMTWEWTQWESLSTVVFWWVHTLFPLFPALVLQNRLGLLCSAVLVLALLAGGYVTSDVWQRGTSASMWCWFTVGIPVMYIVCTS